MYELKQINKNNYYINSPSKIGVIKLNETDVCLIDSGNDKDAAIKVLRIIKENKWNLKAIYNTHSHADHIGGNKYLQDNTGCKIYTTEIESIFAKNTILEPTLLYGGFPIKELKNKFLMAKESDIEVIKTDNIPESIQIIPLKGHSLDMIGFKTIDNVVYLADCIFSEETLDKYKISYIYDVGAFLKTLEYIMTIEAEVFVPAHAEILVDVTFLAQLNIDKVNEVADNIVDICKEPINFENILKNVLDYYKLTINFNQYVLVGNTIKSYLSWLKENNRVEVIFKDNMLLWKKI